MDDGAAFYLRASEERFREDETLREEIEQARSFEQQRRESCSVTIQF